jgi:hypothetical protein
MLGDEKAFASHCLVARLQTPLAFSDSLQVLIMSQRKLSGFSYLILSPAESADRTARAERIPRNHPAPTADLEELEYSVRSPDQLPVLTDVPHDIFN